MKEFFKGVWTGMLLTYIYCNELAMKWFPKATVLSWIVRRVFVFITMSIDIILIPIMSIIMIIKVIRLGRSQAGKYCGRIVEGMFESDVLSDQGREDSVEVIQNLLDKK